MKKNYLIRAAVLVLPVIIALTGCGSGNSSDEAVKAGISNVVTADEESQKGTETEAEGSVKAEETAKTEESNKTEESAKAASGILGGKSTKKESAASSEDSTTAEGSASEDDSKEIAETSGQSLARRMCGKYSYHVGEGNLTDDEYYVMDVISFGDNLYAYCGQAAADDEGNLEVYSFWTSEFVPFDEDAMKSTESDTVKVNELRFSIMSNAGKYWDSGCEGSITFTNKGLVFEGFKGDGFLAPMGDRGYFLRDDRAEDAFLNLDDSQKPGDPDLEGFWFSEINASAAYLEFKGSDIMIYQKKPDTEVYFSAGRCDFSGSSFSSGLTTLGNGGMPSDISAEYEVKGDVLTISFEGDVPDGFEGKRVFSRISESDIHVTTTDEIVFYEDSFGMFSAEPQVEDADDSVNSESYYGVFLSASKDASKFEPVMEKLENAGLEGQVLYTPDFEKLNPEPYYVVNVGLFVTEQEAQECLESVKKAGFDEAYVKDAGSYIGKKFYYTMTDTQDIEIWEESIILRSVKVSIPYDTGREGKNMTIYMRKDTTKFADTCDFTGFSNYEEGDTPYQWFSRNYDLSFSDPDKYLENGPALVGIFEVSIEDDLITAYYGSYWWD